MRWFAFSFFVSFFLRSYKQEGDGGFRRHRPMRVMLVGFLFLSAVNCGSRQCRTADCKKQYPQQHMTVVPCFRNVGINRFDGVGHPLGIECHICVDRSIKIK